MTTRTTLLAILFASAPVAHAQTPPKPTAQTAAQEVRGAAGIPPCPTFAEQKRAAGEKTASGSERLAAQPAERSGILPSGGTTGKDASAAPTTQDGGKAYRNPLDCPLIPEHPNAPLPGPPPMPSLSR